MSLLRRINETRIAQLAHFAWGAYIPVQLIHLGVHNGLAVLAVTLLIPAVKELIECIPYHGKSLAPWEAEGIQTISDGILDFSFFVLGTLSLL